MIKNLLFRFALHLKSHSNRVFLTVFSHSQMRTIFIDFSTIVLHRFASLENYAASRSVLKHTFQTTLTLFEHPKSSERSKSQKMLIDFFVSFFFSFYLFVFTLLFVFISFSSPFYSAAFVFLSCSPATTLFAFSFSLLFTYFPLLFLFHVIKTHLESRSPNNNYFYLLSFRSMSFYFAHKMKTIKSEINKTNWMQINAKMNHKFAIN